MKKPKIRELKEATKALFGPRFTSRFPKIIEPPPEAFRGKPDYQESCLGCSGCYNVCPAGVIEKEDLVEENSGTRTLTIHLDNCIFCGQCELYCTSEEGIKLSREYDLAFLGDEEPMESVKRELLICEACGAVVGAKDHIRWLHQKLGPKAYANPSIFLPYLADLDLAKRDRLSELPSHRSDRMRVLCPNCRRILTWIEEGTSGPS